MQSVKRAITVTHYHNSLKQPVLTRVDVIEADGSIGRGFAVCAIIDTFNGKRGRRIALGRAFAGLKLKKNNRPIRRSRVFARLKDLAFMPSFKSNYYAPDETFLAHLAINQSIQ